MADERSSSGLPGLLAYRAVLVLADVLSGSELMGRDGLLIVSCRFRVDGTAGTAHTSCRAILGARTVLLGAVGMLTLRTVWVRVEDSPVQAGRD